MTIYIYAYCYFLDTAELDTQTESQVVPTMATMTTESQVVPDVDDSIVPSIPVTVSASCQTEPGLVNQLVWNGQVSEDLCNILCPPLAPLKAKSKRKLTATNARRLTSSETITSLQEAHEKTKTKKTKINTDAKGAKKGIKKGVKKGGRGKVKSSTQQTRNTEMPDTDTSYNGEVFEIVTAAKDQGSATAVSAAEQLGTSATAVTTAEHQGTLSATVISTAEHQGTGCPAASRPRRKAAAASLALISTVDIDDFVDEDDDDVDDAHDDDDDVLCGTCGLRDPVGFTGRNIDWIGCEFCAAWSHSTCSNMVTGESLFICSECISL